MHNLNLFYQLTQDKITSTVPNQEAHHHIKIKEDNKCHLPTEPHNNSTREVQEQISIELI